MAKMNILCNRQRGYANFRRYLFSQTVELNYLIADDQSDRSSRQWYYFLSFSVLIITEIRLILLLFLDEVSNLSYYLGDITLVAGAFRKQLLFIYISWISATFTCSVVLFTSQFNPRLQKWAVIGVIFDHLTTTSVHPVSDLPSYLHRYFIVASKVTFYTAAVGGFLIGLPSYFNFPSEYTYYLHFWTIVTMYAGVLVIGHSGNFGPLFAFKVYLFGHQITNEKKFLTRQLKTLSISDSRNAEKLKRCEQQTRRIVAQSCRSATRILRLLIDGYQFWSRINHPLFMATFNAQSIILYLVFFIDIPRFLRIALIILGILSWLSGLSCHFIAGAYGQRKVVLENTSNLLLLIATLGR
ncbi:uncharacterized protein LOC128397040 [Panonychus citri]|uniref:uncharacterized protein LOC128397040 n=1 Tax=Panonychus citri TaxID=50023 RepID=UPI00230828FC|nr:uncharacterized protein LOC128397040 [Panonychus citri]